MYFSLSAAGRESVELHVEPGPVLGPMPPLILNYNAQLMIHEAPWDDPSFVEQLVWLRPQGLRFPGGTVANYYDWRTGLFVEDSSLVRPRYIQANKRIPKVHGPEGYRLEAFQVAVEASGAEPVYVVNMLTSTMDEQLAWLKHAESLGLPVRYIELGNEFYLPAESNVKRFPEPQDYAEEAVRWAEALREEFPDAKVAAVGCGYRGREGRAHREDGWNAGLGDLPGIDAVTLHVYYGTGMNVIYPGHPLYQPREGAELENTPGRSMYGPESSQEAQRVMLRTPGVRQRAFEHVYSRHEETLAIMDELEGKEIWLTEHNFFDRVGPVQLSWIRGLGCALANVLFLDRPEQITMGGHHNLGGGEAFAVLLYLPESGEAARTAVAYAYEALAGPFHDAYEVGIMSVQPRIPLLVDGKDSGYEGVLARWFRGREADWAVVFNLTDDEHRMDTPFPGEEATYRILTAEDMGARIVNGEGLVELSGDLGEGVILPPLSLAVIRKPID